MLNCLQVKKKHHALTDKDDYYLKLLDACLENYLIFGSKQALLEAVDINSRANLMISLFEIGAAGPVRRIN